MRDGIKSPTDAFESFHAPRLSPAEGLESDASLFTAPPIESLELLRELGEIAAASFRPFEPLPEASPEIPEVAAAPSVSAPVPSTPAAPNAPAKTADEKLMEALLEYHRLRGPKLGARTSPRPTGGFARVDASTESGNRFSSVEIPVVQDAIPKESPAGLRASRPGQSILKPKPRP